MSKSNVFNNEWIDLVFEGRNKKYGAYQLRQQDSRTTAIALFSGIALMGLAAGIPAAVTYLSGAPQQTAIVTTDTGGLKVTEFIVPEMPKVPEPPKAEPKVPKEAAAPAAPSTSTIKFTETLVATSEPVPDPPHTDDFTNKNPGPETVEGVKGGNSMSVTPGVIGGTGKNPDALAPEGPMNVNMVDEMPLYPGGMERFYSEVGRKYRVPETDKEMTVKVYVSFIIEKDGTMTGIKILRDPGMGLGKEALRVLESMKTKWKPGRVKGNSVRTAYNLPITVNIK